ncbi:YbjN domain-containing protein [Leptolyngbya sp. 'hensonii']|uniref:YbjN domain-containing protein n=1 Tax=Leptolyngbya sp. 'hensonii' TaxID=1922337 RepID=UPI00094FDEFF|nr:YbjN domain-containing protein [Leptolyngbya sp. 'hensonii']OLP19034.1 YbjN domain-containing protein [Leptolyngbya sp. 'hensonii']
MTTYQPESEKGSHDDLVTDLIEDAAATSMIDVIETVISSLDHENTAMVSHGDAGHLWKFKYGSVEVFVQFTGETDEDTLTVWSSILPLPVKHEPQLLRKLLEMNWDQTFEARFGIFNQAIVVLTSRTVAELSPGEISRAITVVATIADDNDEALLAEFGAA